MIAAHQPTIFGDDVLVRVSSKAEGTVLDRTHDIHAKNAVDNRKAWCKQLAISYHDVVYQQIMYSSAASYSLIAEVDERNKTPNCSGVIADVLITNQAGAALFLPIADCVATVMYDPTHKVLAVLHLGRHSSMTNVVAKTISFMQTAYGSHPHQLQAWLSPAAQKNSYKLAYFDPPEAHSWNSFITQLKNGILVDLPAKNKQALVDAGLSEQNIEVSTVDTFTSDTYFSHSAGDVSGRFAVVAQINA